MYNFLFFQFQEIILNSSTSKSLINNDENSNNNNNSIISSSSTFRSSSSLSSSINTTTLITDGDINYEDTIKLLTTMTTATHPPPTDELTAGAKFKYFDCDYYLAINVSMKRRPFKDQQQTCCIFILIHTIVFYFY